MQKGFFIQQEVPHPLLLEFIQDVQQALGENWSEYQRDVADLALHWPTEKVALAQAPGFARAYMLDTAKSAADLLLLWLQLRRVIQPGEELNAALATAPAAQHPQVDTSQPPPLSPPAACAEVRTACTGPAAS